MCKKVLTLLMTIVIAMSLCGCSINRSNAHAISAEEFDKKWNIARSSEKSKVIIDTDAMYVNDDAYAALLAVQADSLGYIDLLGFTASSCNVFAAASAHDIMYLLKEIGRSDIPVYLGQSKPRNGFVDIENVKKISGLASWYGCYAAIDSYTEDLDKVYEAGLCRSPEKLENFSVPDEPAEDFIIDQVHRYPGEVTIITLSSLTTIAKAIEKDKTVVDDAAGIIMMGGDFGASIDKLRDYEINFWFDPEATNMVLAAPWKESIISSSDASLTCLRDKGVYEQFKSKNTTPVSKCIVDSLAPIYEYDKVDKLPYCWDPMTIVYYLCPDIMTGIEERAVCVDEREGLTYGLTRDWKPGSEPEGVSTHSIIFESNKEAFWEFITDICSIRCN